MVAPPLDRYSLTSDLLSRVTELAIQVDEFRARTEELRERVAMLREIVRLLREARHGRLYETQETPSRLQSALADGRPRSYWK